MRILDTDFIIAVLRKDAQSEKKLIEMQESGEAVATTVFNEQEVLYGPIKYQLRKEMEAAKAFFGGIDILNYERFCVPYTVAIIISLEKAGLPIGTLDELVAGICLANNAGIVTRNIGHFSMIPNLKVEKW